MSVRRPRQRLAFLVGLLYFAMNLVSIALFTYVITNTQIELISDNTRYQARDLMSSVVQSMLIAGYRGNQDEFVLIRDVFTRVSLPYVVFQNTEVKARSADSLRLPAKYRQHAAQAKSVRQYSGVDYFAVFEPEKQWLDFYIPLDSKNCRDCTIFSRIELREFGKRFRILYQSVAITIVILTLLHILFGFILHRAVIRPILALHTATQKVADGHLDYRVNLERDDELGNLARGFNTMTATIQEQMVSLQKQMEEIRQAKETMEWMSITDELTKLYNRRYLFDQLRTLMEISERYNNPLGLLILDIDFFKKVNDTYGHQAGDTVLKEVATRLTQMGRKSDILARYGGEEMVILCPQTSLENTIMAGYRFRMAIEKTMIAVGDGQNIRVTVSVGVSEYQALKQHLGRVPTLNEFIESADSALYRAKKGGRNRVDVFNIGGT